MFIGIALKTEGVYLLFSLGTSFHHQDVRSSSTFREALEFSSAILSLHPVLALS